MTDESVSEILTQKAKRPAAQDISFSVGGESGPCLLILGMPPCGRKQPLDPLPPPINFPHRVLCDCEIMLPANEARDSIAASQASRQKVNGVAAWLAGSLSLSA